MTVPRIATELDGVVVEFLDEGQGFELLDLRAQEWLGVSGAEFVRAFCADELDIESPHVGMLYFLMGFSGMDCDAGSDTR